MLISFDKQKLKNIYLPIYYKALSKRQNELLNYLILGKTIEEAAFLMQIGKTTCLDHLMAIKCFFKVTRLHQLGYSVACCLGCQNES